MVPSFDDPELTAIARWLAGAATAPVADERPTPANMPRRTQRPATPADIARSVGLELGDALRPPRSQPVRRQRTRPRPPRPSAFQETFDLMLEGHCSRDEAHRLARLWLEVEQSVVGVRRWTDLIGVQRPHAAQDLVAHGLGTEDLYTVLDGTAAYRRLRNGEPSGQVVAALLARRHQL